jgi:hypothetical protein
LLASLRVNHVAGQKLDYESLAKKRYIPKTVSDIIVENRGEIGMNEDDETIAMSRAVVANTKEEGEQIEEAREPTFADASLFDDDGGSDFTDGPGGYREDSGNIIDHDHGSAPTGTGARVTGDDEDERSLWLGLKVYTMKHGEEPVVIEGWVKEDEKRT